MAGGILAGRVLVRGGGIFNSEFVESVFDVECCLFNSRFERFCLFTLPRASHSVSKGPATGDLHGRGMLGRHRNRRS